MALDSSQTRGLAITSEGDRKTLPALRCNIWSRCGSVLCDLRRRPARHAGLPPVPASLLAEGIPRAVLDSPVKNGAVSAAIRSGAKAPPSAKDIMNSGAVMIRGSACPFRRNPRRCRCFPHFPMRPDLAVRKTVRRGRRRSARRRSCGGSGCLTIRRVMTEGMDAPWRQDPAHAGQQNRPCHV